MLLVVDSNALVALAITPAGLAPLHVHDLVAPVVARSEALSAIHEGVWRREISEHTGVVARDRVLDATIELVGSKASYLDGWQTADRFGFARTYDAMYVALAKRRGIPLVTIDGRLRRAVGDYVQTLGLDDL